MPSSAGFLQRNSMTLAMSLRKKQNKRPGISSRGAPALFCSAGNLTYGFKFPATHSPTPLQTCVTA